MELTQTRRYLINVVHQAGKILEKYFNSKSLATKSKGGSDFVTEADLKVDEFLREKIAARFPNSSFLTEETAPKDYSAFKKKRNLWVIDPIDGTTNFSRKNPYFAISVGLVDKSVPKIGLIHLPIPNLTYWAQEDNKQAILNGKPIRVAGAKTLKEAIIAFDWSWNLQKRLEIYSLIKPLITKIRQPSCNGSAAADCAALAEGKIDAYICTGVKPWDVAAAALILEKAGALISTPKGKKWDIFNPDILASTPAIHKQILTLTNSK